jgi:Tfp pilus assembly protein PilX
VQDPNNSGAIEEKKELQSAQAAIEKAEELLQNGERMVQANALVEAALKLAPQAPQLKLLKVPHTTHTSPLLSPICLTVQAISICSLCRVVCTA